MSPSTWKDSVEDHSMTLQLGLKKKKKRRGGGEQGPGRNVNLISPRLCGICLLVSWLLVPEWTESNALQQDSLATRSLATVWCRRAFKVRAIS